MKRLIPAMAVLLLIAAVPVFALDQTTRADQTVRPSRTVIVVGDVIRMSQAGVSDDAIIAYVRNLREPFDVNADDMIAMTDANVSQAVVKVVVDEAAVWKDRRETAREQKTTSRSTVYVTAPYYDPWYYPYAYDPFSYGRRLSFGFGFGYSRGFIDGGFDGGFGGGFEGSEHGGDDHE